jgi:hypothetical protein
LIKRKILPSLARKEIVGRKSVHERKARYKSKDGRGGTERSATDEYEYSQFLEEDFYLDYHESEFDAILDALLSFSAAHEFDLETEMPFDSFQSGFVNGELDKDETITFIHLIAKSISALVEEDQDNDHQDSSESRGP